MSHYGVSQEIAEKMLTGVKPDDILPPRGAKVASSEPLSLADITSGLDEWLNKAEDRIKGKQGSPAIRTFIKEVKARLKALIDKEKNTELTSLDQQVNAIREAWTKQFYPDSGVMPSNEGWVSEIFESYVIVDKGDHFLKIPFTKQGGEIVFQVDNSVKMRRVYEEIKDSLASDKSGAGTDTENEKKEEAMLDELKKLYGLAEDASEEQVLEAVRASKEAAEAKDNSISLAELEATTAKVTSLQEKINLKERDERLSMAMRAGKIKPAQKEWADNYALADPEGFDVFVLSQPVIVKLGEVGAQGGDTSPQITEKEQEIADKVGNTTEELLEEKKLMVEEGV